jgi:hypothetical protein
VNAWAIVASGAIGGVLGIVASFGGAIYQQRVIGRREAASARKRVYVELLSRSLTLLHRVQALRDTARLRSGLSEALDVLTRQRRLLDPMQLVDWLMQDMQPAYDAWSAVWASAPPTIVQSANELIAHCSEVIGAVGHPKPTERVQKVRTLILGVQRDAVSDTRFQEKP